MKLDPVIKFICILLGLLWLLVIILTPTAHSQESSQGPQRAFIIASLAQQLGQAEIKAEALQAELAKAQNDAEDWKATFNAWCGSAPNCGRPSQ